MERGGKDLTEQEKKELKLVSFQVEPLEWINFKANCARQNIHIYEVMRELVREYNGKRK